MSETRNTRKGTGSSGNNNGLRRQGTAAEKKAHQDSLKRQKQYKKKRKQQIVGLVLECVLLVIVVGAYIGIDYVYSTLRRITDITQTTTAATAPLPTLPRTGPEIAPTDETTQKPTPPTGPTDPTPEIPDDTENPNETVEFTYPEVNVPDRNGFYTFVLFGVDARNNDHLLGGTQGDVCIIASINKSTGEIRLASVYRDYCMEYNPEVHRKLTDCYARYGAQEVMELLNRNLDLNITHFVAVNWLCLVDLVDIFDGLDVYLTEAEAEAVDKYVWEVADVTGRPQDPDYMFIGNFHKIEGANPETDDPWYYMDGYHEGTWHLNGIQTTAYSRLRYGLGDDYKRTERQRTVINLLVEKAKSSSLTKIMEAINMIAENKLRTSLPISDITALALRYKDYHLGSTSGYPSAGIVSNKNLSWQILASDMVGEVKKLHATLYDDFDYVPSENVERIAAYMKQRIAEAAQAQ